MDSEIFVPIRDYPNYQISNFGRVKNGSGQILKHFSDKDGYLRLKIYNEDGGKNFKLHRLVSLHFIPNPNNKPYVDHIDHNKTNNHISNLRFCTHQENHFNTKKINKETYSRFKGVSFHKHKNKWVSNIRINGIKTHLGYFSNEEDARDAYVNKAKELHKEFYYDQSESLTTLNNSE
jgi:hypothetical protein